MSGSAFDQELMSGVVRHLEVLYSAHHTSDELNRVAGQLIEVMTAGEAFVPPPPHKNLWSQNDVVLITYGDTICSDGKAPLHVLGEFLDKYCQDTFSSVHILPFFPYSSDDGFAVINYAEVNHALGEWEDIEEIAGHYRLMSDLVINHCSSRSLWFENYKQGRDPGRDYCIEADPSEDLSSVVRPRTSPLLREVETSSGTRWVWCTFSPDQVDLNFRSIKVLMEFVRIIRLYLDHGIRLFRLDAVAFLWKEIGSSCLNLEQTHELIRLIRLLLDYSGTESVIITETNIPNRENLAYFGNANEAHCIYNFSLAPLLVNTMLTGDCSVLKRWMMTMPPAQNGTAYLNFIASHDGIGLRPAEGLLSRDEINAMIECMQAYGGKVSWRSESGERRPYEINISLIDAMSGTLAGKDEWQVERFLCAHALMMSLEGIPAIYIHSLVSTFNDYDKATHSGNNRAINRHQWDWDELDAELQDEDSIHRTIYEGISSLISIRSKQAAFHPNATQYTLHFGNHIFGFWRQSMDRAQSIFCIYNVSSQTQALALADINLIEMDQWQDLITGKPLPDLSHVLTLEPYQYLWITNRPLISAK